MGFVIWFQVEIAGAGPGGGPLRVSNDVFSGDYVLDADIQVDLVAGAAASPFRVTMANLPADVADGLKDRHRQGLARRDPLGVTVSLGYFDEPAGRTSPVLRGVVTSLRTAVAADGTLQTEIRGQESAGYRLLHAGVPADVSGNQSLSQVVKAIADKAGVTVRSQTPLDAKPSYTLRGTNGLEALRDVTEVANAPLVIGDGAVTVGSLVGTTGSARFTAADNIVSLERRQEEAITDDLRDGGQREARTSLDLIVLGDPTLRVGQAVEIKVDDPRDALSGRQRTERVRHIFSTRQGYTCEVTVVVAAPGTRARQASGAQGLADRMRDVAETVHDQRPALDVGQVSGYADGASGQHLATLRYGQSPPPDAVSPSVELPVDEEPLLHAKPVASPFAFHRCGLVVPVLPGMRALLGHNRGLVNDAVVTGFLWAEQPAMQRPKSLDGDWWLCLPTELDGDGLPAGKGVNDLTDRTGLRVIQASGLRITVGPGTLPEVGDRPEPPAGATLVIEHESGTTVTVGADGAVSVDAGGQAITLKSGDASITLDGGAITLTGTTVQVA